MTDEILREMFPATDPKVFEEKQAPQATAEEREAFPETYTETTPRTAAPAAPAHEPVAAFGEEVKRWGEESRAEFGEAFDQTIRDARGVLDRYGDKELRAALDSSGLGNHRAVIRLLARIAREGR